MNIEKYYRIEVKENEQLIVIRVLGAWSLDAVIQYNQDLLATIKKLNHQNGFSILYDTTQGSILSEEVSAKIMEVVPELERLGLKKTALVIISAIIRMQATRLIKESALSEKTQYFASEEEALGWLAP
ncbi:MAG: hypothetical protein IV090_21365 [Candidatus Sericytochromatia bacterium]|nr:hypothetical protein [Candidatus Sericytochromatia bacterium]